MASYFLVSCLLFLKTSVNIPSVSTGTVIKKFWIITSLLLAFWKPLEKRAGSVSKRHRSVTLQNRIHDQNITTYGSENHNLRSLAYSLNAYNTQLRHLQRGIREWEHKEFNLRKMLNILLICLFVQIRSKLFSCNCEAVSQKKLLLRCAVSPSNFVKRFVLNTFFSIICEGYPMFFMRVGVFIKDLNVKAFLSLASIYRVTKLDS